MGRMNILVIGGTRFMGPHVVRRLVEEGHRVAVFHRGESEAAGLSDVEHVHGDRSNLEEFRPELERLAPRVVLDMVAFTEEHALSLMRAFRGVAARLVVASSMDVYAAYGRLLRLEPGPAEPEPLTEDSPVRADLYPYRAKATSPEDFKYNYDKIPVERAVLSDPTLPGTVLRLPAVYGPEDRQHRTFEHLKRMDDGRRAILVEDRAATWRWTRGYVEDVAAAIALTVTDDRAAGRVYNIGEADPGAEADWIRAIGRAAGWDGDVVAVPRDLLPEHLASDLDWDHHMVVDTGRIRRELGYREHVAPEEAMARTIAWERANPPAEVDPQRFDYAAEDAALAKVR
jgi:nucleoside-diphosphate-sugar epimerase